MHTMALSRRCHWPGYYYHHGYHQCHQHPATTWILYHRHYLGPIPLSAVVPVTSVSQSPVAHVDLWYDIDWVRLALRQGTQNLLRLAATVVRSLGGTGAGFEIVWGRRVSVSVSVGPNHNRAVQCIRIIIHCSCAGSLDQLVSPQNLEPRTGGVMTMSLWFSSIFWPAIIYFSPKTSSANPALFIYALL